MPQTEVSPAKDPWLTPRQVSQQLGYRSKTNHSVLRLIKSGALRAARYNARCIRIRQSEVNRFLAEASGLTC
ncbi:helix-turn-helix domain-containing protein [Coraliomargarita sp. SDUM461003]|uniref:Helix-turn-helix domain-containing protein n=1 Tax=Thalassobacterium maritimum TaxID=3041265 RepID=A0ABU1AVJ1_9BACT|nr:helix-turn-helix domain-containing protein [Coraliomargarita sp. SDUM461003]MDQ8208171.1 helix-turn-helix domain-containing protein [Coraliomargarita sp. SDUM461003]